MRLALQIKVQMPGKWDNTAIIEEIMTLRVELAKLLGFNTYTERSLATKMAEKSTTSVRLLKITLRIVQKHKVRKN